MLNDKQPREYSSKKGNASLSGWITHRVSNSTKCLDVKSDRWHVQHLQKICRDALQISDAELIVTNY